MTTSKWALVSGVAFATAVAAAGCGMPEQMVPAAPPGIDIRRELAPKEEGDNAPQANGEQPLQSGTAPKASNVVESPPALPTAKGETKTTARGVKYTTLQEGTGAVAKSGNRVTVHYTGTLEDGRKFDSSRDRNEPATFSIGTGDVIPGWDEAVPGMRIGERRRLTVPPAAGYGAQGKGPIPPNATLLFDIELINVQ